MMPLALTRPLCIVDVESTSTDPVTARIVEIALERWMPDGTMTAYATLINPGVPIPAEATAVHGITDAMVADSPTWAQRGAQIMRAFRGDFGVADLAGYNVRFDAGVIAAENKRHGIDDETPEGTVPQSVDAFRMWQFLEPRSLSDAAVRWLKRSTEGAHRAMADVTTTREVLFAQVASDDRLRGKSVADILAIVNPPDPNAATSDGKLRFIEGGLALNFGKSKGVPLRQADAGLLRWMLGRDFAADTKRLIEAELRLR